jgi:UDP-glucose 4-epimerase
LRSTVVRLFSVYGPHLQKQLLWDVCSRLQRNEQTLVLGGTGAETRDWTDVRDVVRLLALIGRLPPDRQTCRIINGGSGRGTSVAQIAAMLAKNLQRDVAIRYSGARRAGDPFSLLADDTALLQLPFDWRISLEQGIVDYVTWFKDHVRD